ncbi:hypothetical protein [uncultured Gammaproteobacteria bacterium]|nr:hypothetical protein [uncultured Gammaproteobacteria bacterium]CAC9965800.1 hypothetical protein [uncultured Gammaproteobacteria bacterium]
MKNNHCFSGIKLLQWFDYLIIGVRVNKGFAINFFYDKISFMKFMISLCFLMLISLVNAKDIKMDDNTHFMQQAMMQSMGESVDCCSENIHISCGFLAINALTIFSQKIINSMNLSVPVFAVSYSSFIVKPPTPPPTV